MPSTTSPGERDPRIVCQAIAAHRNASVSPRSDPSISGIPRSRPLDKPQPSTAMDHNDGCCAAAVNPCLPQLRPAAVRIFRGRGTVRSKPTGQRQVKRMSSVAALDGEDNCGYILATCDLAGLDRLLRV